MQDGHERQRFVQSADRMRFVWIDHQHGSGAEDMLDAVAADKGACAAQHDDIELAN